MCSLMWKELLVTQRQLLSLWERIGCMYNHFLFMCHVKWWLLQLLALFLRDQQQVWLFNGTNGQDSDPIFHPSHWNKYRTRVSEATDPSNNLSLQQTLMRSCNTDLSSPSLSVLLSLLLYCCHCSIEEVYRKKDKYHYFLLIFFLTFFILREHYNTVLTFTQNTMLLLLPTIETFVYKTRKQNTESQMNSIWELWTNSER